MLNYAVDQPLSVAAAGKAPARIYLCGGSSGMPYMREFFQEKLQVPIEFLNPVRNVAIANEADPRRIARSAHLLGELVGLGLRAVASCPMELNLRPASVIRAHEVERRRPFLIGAAACVIAALLGWSVFYMHAAGVLSAIKRQVDTKVTTLRGFQTRIDGIRKEATTLDSVASPLLDAVMRAAFGRSCWKTSTRDCQRKISGSRSWFRCPMENRL